MYTMEPSHGAVENIVFFIGKYNTLAVRSTEIIDGLRLLLTRLAGLADQIKISFEIHYNKLVA